MFGFGSFKNQIEPETNRIVEHRIFVATLIDMINLTYIDIGICDHYCIDFYPFMFIISYTQLVPIKTHHITRLV